MDWPTLLKQKDDVIYAQQTQLTELTARAEQQNAQIAELTERTDQIKMLSEELINSSYQSEQQCQVKTQENIALLNEINQLKRQIQELQDSAGRLPPEAVARMKELEEEQRTLQQIVSQVQFEKEADRRDLERRISLMEKERADLQKKTTALESKIGATTELEQKLLVANRNNDMLLQEKRNLQTKVIEVEHRSKQWEQHEQIMANYQKDIAQLHSEKDAIKKKLNETETEIQELSKFKHLSESFKLEQDSFVKQYDAKLKEAEDASKKTIDNLKNEINEIQNKNDELESKLKTASQALQKIQELDDQNRKLKKEIETRTTKIEQLEFVNKENREKLTSLKSFKDQQDSVVQQFQSEIDQLKEQNAALTTNLEKYQGKSSRLIELENQTKSLMEINQQLEQHLNAIQKGVPVSSKTLLDNKQTSANLQEQYKILVEESKKLKEQASKADIFEKELKKAAEKGARLEKEITGLKTQGQQVSPLQEKIQGLMEINTNIQQEANQFKQENNNFRKQLAEMEDLKSGFNSLKELNFKLEDVNDALSKEINAFKRKVNELSETQQNFTKLRETYGTLENSNRDLQNTNNSLRFQLKELETLKTGFNSLKKLNTDLEDKNSELKKQLTSVQRKLDYYAAGQFEQKQKELETKVQALNDTIKFKENEMVVKEQRLKALNEVEKNYQMTASEKNNLEIKLKTYETRLEKLAALESKLVEYQDMRMNLMQDKSRIENESRNLKQKITQLERQFQDAELTLQKNRQIEEENMLLKSQVKRLTLQVESHK